MTMINGVLPYVELQQCMQVGRRPDGKLIGRGPVRSEPT
jgi:hypothetical protein